MSQPENYTAAQASDPSTPAQVLADIAAQRPDLRPAVAANPSTYPGLLEWLRNLGDPAVDAASDAIDRATDILPTPIGTTEPDDDDIDIADARDYGDNAVLDALWDACADEDWAACDDLYRQATRGTAYWNFGDTCGGAWDANTTDWCVDAMTGGATGDDEFDDSGITEAQRIWFEALASACGAGDWDACDLLYMESPSGSSYEHFGTTCGGAGDGTFWCDLEFGDGVDPDRMTRGSDPGFDALWIACEGGLVEACDLLYWESPADSEYEAFARDRV